MELWIDRRPREDVVVRCAGILNRSTCSSLLCAVCDALDGGAFQIVVDVTDLTIEDSVGANALSTIQRVVREGGMTLRWVGLGYRTLAQGTAA